MGKIAVLITFCAKSALGDHYMEYVAKFGKSMTSTEEYAKRSA